jgi:hypothetical protein
MNKLSKICAASALVFASNHSFAADVLSEPTAGPLGPTESVSGAFMTSDGNTVLSVV